MQKCKIEPRNLSYSFVNQCIRMLNQNKSCQNSSPFLKCVQSFSKDASNMKLKSVFQIGITVSTCMITNGYFWTQNFIFCQNTSNIIFGDWNQGLKQSQFIRNPLTENMANTVEEVFVISILVIATINGYTFCGIIR